MFNENSKNSLQEHDLLEGLDVTFFKWLILLIAVFVAVIPANRALAIASPNSISILTINAFQNTVESNDILFIASYNIDYTSNPTETVTQAFIFRLMDGGTELGSTAPFSFINAGYDGGVVALYFSASDVALIPIVWEGAGYEVRLQGNPSLFASPPVVVNSSIDWNSVLTTKSDLRNLLNDLATDLQLNWAQYTEPDIELLTTAAAGNVFTQEGEVYFGNVIPNVRIAASGLFTGRTTLPVVTERTFTLSYRDQLLQFWDTSSIGTALQGAADVFNTPRSLITTLGLVAFNVAIIMAMVKANPAAGQIAPLTTAIILPVGAYVGLTDMVFAALIAMFATFGTVFILFLRRG